MFWIRRIPVRKVWRYVNRSLMLVAFTVMQPPPPDLPQAPIVGLNAVGKWIFDLLFAVLTIFLAINVFKAARGLLNQLGFAIPFISSGEASGAPAKQIFRPALWIAITIIFMIAAVRVPPLIIADASSIDSLWVTLYKAGKSIIGVGAGSVAQ